MTVITPCRGHGPVYDTALSRTTPVEKRREARRIAAGLCAGCPIADTCGDRVTIPAPIRRRKAPTVTTTELATAPSAPPATARPADPVRPDTPRTEPPAARIQRRRTKGWRMPEGAVYVGRGTRWGNPYRLGDTQVRYPAIDGTEWEHEGRLGKTSGQRHAFVHPGGRITWHLVQDATAEQVVALYRRWLAGRPALVEAARTELAGRDLMCWCPLPEPGQPDHCHAAVLLELANAPAEVTA